MLSMFIWFDAIHGVQSGNVRALNQQLKASIVTLVCYYAIGMPLAWHFGFGLNMGIKGFWQGFFIALIILDAGVIYVVVRASWENTNSDKKKNKKEVSAFELTEILDAEPGTVKSTEATSYS